MGRGRERRIGLASPEGPLRAFTTAGLDRSSGRFAGARRLIAWAWTIAIFVLLWMPPPPPPKIVWPWWDSLVHLGLLAGFGALWIWRGLPTARVLALGVLIGAVTEIVQGMLPWERHSSWGDFAFDVLGLALGFAFARALERAIARR